MMKATDLDRFVAGGPCAGSGLTKQTEERVARRTEAQERRMRRAATRAAEGVADKYDGCDIRPPELPAEFIEEGTALARERIRYGHFDALRDLADLLEEKWQAEQITLQPLAMRPLGVRLATHIAACRDHRGKRVDNRVVHLVESVCAGTLGSVREVWPQGFFNLVNCGPVYIKEVGLLLLSAALIDREEYESGVASLGKKLSNARSEAEIRRRFRRIDGVSEGD